MWGLDRLKLQIYMMPDGKNICTESDFTDAKDSGEIAHFIAELERIKLDLIAMWEEYKEGEWE